jgi:hypothetical protein
MLSGVNMLIVAVESRSHFLSAVKSRFPRVLLAVFRDPKWGAGSGLSPSWKTIAACKSGEQALAVARKTAPASGSSRLGSRG